MLFTVNQHKVRLDMAVTKILQIARERMVAVTRFKWLIIREALYNGEQLGIERSAVLTSGLEQDAFKLNRRWNLSLCFDA